MAVQTVWSIDHACGHADERDLSSRPADKRASFARWLSAQDCTDCWRASRERTTVPTQEWLAAKRAEEQQAAADWAVQYDMPPLEGSARAVPWGERCRHELVVAAYTSLVVEGAWGDGDWALTEEKIRTVLRAGWWIDQREAAGTDLPELLDAATVNDLGNENPFR
ncbi:hypothetical protein [Streptomyces sp. NPDC051561]|uniref:hypothetical protein n=1 Tax=Streptomyces sp. NPDC051561 TaxID=3365658 RepID=UPI0037B8FE25